MYIILCIVEIKAHESQCLFIHVLDLRIALKHAPYEVHGVIDTLKINRILLLHCIGWDLNLATTCLATFTNLLVIVGLIFAISS